MPQLAAVAAVAAVALAAAAVAPVPPRAQRAIAKRTNVYDYAPARVPAGFRYTSWAFMASPPLLRIFFDDAGKRREIIFAAAAQLARCNTGSERTFHVAGVRVFYTHTPVTQQAWRCLPHRGITIRLIAATRQPPSQLRPSLLATTAAAARLIR
jgi:hypothetical protein